MSGLFKKQSSSETLATTMNIQTSVEGLPIPILFGRTRIAGNLIWYGDFHSTKKSSSTKGGKGSSSKTGGTTDYSAAVVIALCQGPASVLQMWDSSTAYDLSYKSLSAWSGDYSQSAWGYLSSLHPDQALAYRGLCYVAAGPMDLGSSPNLPSLNFEVQGPVGNAVTGIPDAHAADCLNALLTESHYGLAPGASILGDLSAWRSYAASLGIFISPAITSQRSVQDILKEWLEATGCNAVFSSGALTVVPYAANSTSGNGYSWTGPTAPLFALADDDFILLSDSDEPIKIKRKRGSDAKNVVRIEYANRAQSYNPAIVSATDEASIETYGQLPADLKNWHFIALSSSANVAAQLVLSREAIRAEYTFVVGPEFIQLDPMDIVSVTSTRLGLSAQWVRILEMSEGSNGELTIVAEEMPDNAGGTATYTMQAGSGYQPNYNVTPPSANAPVVLAAPPEVAQGLELWLVVSGPSGWGGANVWVSGDGSSFTSPGPVHGGAVQGTLVSALPAVADPDTTSSLVVDLTMSDSALISWAKADADLYRSLCYICNEDGSNGEFIAYQTANLTGSDTYTLTYLRRGLYGTSPVAHASGSMFAFLDGKVKSIPYTKDQIGTPLHIKLTSVNVYGGGEEEISAVTDHIVTLPAPPPPEAVTGFAISQVGNVVTFRWDNTLRDWALEGYDIFYSPVGSDQRVILTEAHRGTEMTNASVPPGTLVFGIMGRDIFGQVGEVTILTFTVANNNGQLAVLVETAPLWTGSVTGLLQHYTGALIPDSAKAAKDHTLAELFEMFVAYPVDDASLVLPTLDTGAPGASIVYTNINVSAGRGRANSRADFQLKSWTDAEPANYSDWIGGGITARYFKGKISINPSMPSVLWGLSMTVDGPVSSQTMADVAVMAGGSYVTFPTPFRQAPVVQLTPSSSGVTSGGISSVTASGCTVTLFNGTTPVAGSANLTITGA